MIQIFIIRTTNKIIQLKIRNDKSLVPKEPKKPQLLLPIDDSLASIDEADSLEVSPEWNYKSKILG